MNRTSCLLLCTFLLFIISCKKEEKYPGYTETESGLYFKLLSIGENTLKARTGDYFQVSLDCKTLKDSIFFDMYSAGPLFIPYNKPVFDGSFEEGCANMNEGDSASFIVSADSVFQRFFQLPLPYFLKKGDKIKVNLRIDRILSPVQYQQIVELSHQKLEDRDMDEQLKLEGYIKMNHPGISPFEPGMYYIPLREGTGPSSASGNVVVVKYQGTFLDGKVFDNAYLREPLEFLLGEQQQVISGLEKGIHLMKEGGKAKFIISSQLAFGENGSSTGIVPAYTTVVYDVELLKVK